MFKKSQKQCNSSPKMKQNTQKLRRYIYNKGKSSPKFEKSSPKMENKFQK